MSKVITLADRGISPALSTSMEALRSEIWAAIDKAADVGVPAGLIVGQLELLKVAYLAQVFEEVEANAAP